MWIATQAIKLRCDFQILFCKLYLCVQVKLKMHWHVCRTFFAEQRIRFLLELMPVTKLVTGLW